LLLVVDQLEELFTLCSRDGSRREFLAVLSAIAESGHGIVVAALRADFYPQATEHSQLATMLRDRQFIVSPMTVDDLREAIERPAERAGLRLDDGLSELLLHELGARRRQGPEAGALPLLSHALLETWLRREGDRMTVRGYRDSGGIDGAVEATANHAYAGLDAAAQHAARHVLLRLVRIGEDTADTARPVRHADLVRGMPTDAAERALRELTTARLITTDQDEVRISHESLLHAWPLLAGWIESDREWLRARQRLMMDAREWHRLRDPSLLYRGGRLAAVRDRVAGANTAQELDRESAAFFQTSIRRERRAARLRRAVVTALSLLLVAALTGAAIAWRQSLNAQRQAEISAARGLIASAESIRDSDPRLALQLGVAALRLDPNRAADASLAETLTTTGYAGTLPGSAGPATAIALSPDGHTLAVGGQKQLTIWDVAQPNRPVRLGEPLSNFSGAVSALAWAPDGVLLFAGDSGIPGGTQGHIRAWNMTNRAHPWVPFGIAVDLPDITSSFTDIVWATDERSFAVRDRSTVYLFGFTSADGGSEPNATIPAPWYSHGLFALSRNGRLLVVNDESGMDAQLWDLTDRRHPRPVGSRLSAYGFTGTAAAFSADGRVLATGTPNSGFQLWDVRKPEQPRRIYDSGPTLGLSGAVTSIAFDANDTAILCAGDDGRIQKVLLPVNKPLAEQDPTDGGAGAYVHPAKPLPGHRAPVSRMSYSPTAALLASAGEDGQVLLWDFTNRQRPHYSGTSLDGRSAGPRGLYGLSIGGSQLSSLTQDGRALLWDPNQPGNTLPQRQVVFSAPGSGDGRSFTARVASRLSPDGHWLAVTGYEPGVQLWDMSGANMTKIQTSIGNSSTTSLSLILLAWSGDSRTLALGYNDGKVVLVDVNRSGPPQVVGSIQHTDALHNVLTARTNDRLVSIGRDGTAIIWNIADPTQPRMLGQFTIGQVGSTALSADGRTLAIGHNSAGVTLWDLTDATRPDRMASIRLDLEPPVQDVAFSTDGTILATSSATAIQLWDLSDPLKPRRAGTELFAGDVQSLAFLPGDKTLISQGTRYLNLWDVSMIAGIRGDAAAIACDRLGGEALPTEAWNQYAPGTPYRNTC
jgi:WD40 repeat protein